MRAARNVTFYDPLKRKREKNEGNNNTPFAFVCVYRPCFPPFVSLSITGAIKELTFSMRVYFRYGSGSTSAPNANTLDFVISNSKVKMPFLLFGCGEWKGNEWEKRNVCQIDEEASSGRRCRFLIDNTTAS